MCSQPYETVPRWYWSDNPYRARAWDGTPEFLSRKRFTRPFAYKKYREQLVTTIPDVLESVKTLFVFVYQANIPQLKWIDYFDYMEACKPDDEEKRRFSAPKPHKQPQPAKRQKTQAADTSYLMLDARGEPTLRPNPRATDARRRGNVIIELEPEPLQPEEEKAPTTQAPAAEPKTAAASKSPRVTAPKEKRSMNEGPDLPSTKLKESAGTSNLRFQAKLAAKAAATDHTRPASARVQSEPEKSPSTRVESQKEKKKEKAADKKEAPTEGGAAQTP